MATQPSATVIEDSATTQAMLAALLTAQGFAVQGAVDGEAGVALVLRTDPDLVVLDLELPGMDGFGVCRAIREHSDAYVLMLTGRDSELDKVQGLLSLDAGRVLSRAQLLEHVRGPNWFEGDHSLETHISNLRRKICSDPRRPRLLHTVRGVGYRLQPAS